MTAFAAFAVLLAAAQPPAAEKKPFATEYQGVRVVDDYRWLEGPDNPDVKKWVAAQNKHTRAVLDALPGRDLLRKRFTELLTKREASYREVRPRAGRLFALKMDPALQQAVLVELARPDDRKSERVVVDPNGREPKGRVTIDFYEPSPDGKLVAVSLSANGSEDGTLHVFEVASGRELPDRIARIQEPTAGGSVAWAPRGDAIYYTRYPRKGERSEADLAFFQEVWRHKLGSAESADAYEMGRGLPRIAEIALSSEGDVVLANVANGDGGEHEFFLRRGEGPWTQLSRFEDRLVEGRIGLDGAVYFVSLAGAPRGKVLRVPLDAASLESARVVVPEQAGVIEEIEPAASRLYVAEMLGGPSRLRSFDLSGKDLGIVDTEPVSTVFDLRRLDADSIVFGWTSYREPTAYLRLDPATEKPIRTALFRRPAVDFSDVEVTREECTSPDGTKVPLSILRPKGTRLDGKNPALLTGYGGFNIALKPHYEDAVHVFLEQGVVVAIANLRGGSEFGDAWHEQGKLLHKQNVFDDFAACAKHLVEAGYTTPERLAIEGGSNGGLLMGAALTQHPELFRVVVSHVGIYDMLRVELSPNGVFNVTEFGTVKDPEQFRALRAYSPYHNVKDGVRYPSVLFMTGDHDGRVDPMQSRKMTARLQAASASKRPVLLRTSSTSGHGFGTSVKEKIEELTDSRAFLFHELGVTVKPPGKPSL
ncbi:MAG: prolyl oligopeptidase family serine peptidase [Myxococcales bacterium]